MTLKEKTKKIIKKGCDEHIEKSFNLLNNENYQHEGFTWMTSGVFVANAAKDLFFDLFSEDQIDSFLEDYKNEIFRFILDYTFDKWNEKIGSKKIKELIISNIYDSEREFLIFLEHVIEHALIKYNAFLFNKNQKYNLNFPLDDYRAYYLYNKNKMDQLIVNQIDIIASLHYKNEQIDQNVILKLFYKHLLDD